MPSNAPSATIVVPTFNEAGNVDELLRQLSAAVPPELSVEVIFVDDSTDDTPAVITAAARTHPLPIRLIHRDRPSGGLGGAVVAGLRAARAPWAVVMDGDLQHPPSLVPALLATGRDTDSEVVVATRYAGGGSSDGLSNAYRRQVSTRTKALAAAVLGDPVGSMSDPLSGFFAVRVAALALDAVDPIGYKILLELVVRSRLSRIAEVPFVFGARHSGESKSTLREGLRYLRHLVHLRRAQRAWTPPVPAAGPARSWTEPASGAVPTRVSGGRAARPGARSIEPIFARREPRHMTSTRDFHLTATATAPSAEPASAALNVLVVTSEAPPIVSGISRCVDRLTTGLRGRGHRVDVLSSVQIPRLVLGEWRFSALLAYWLRISRLIDGYDVVNLHGPVPTMSDVFLMLAGARRRIPVVYTHHCALAIRGVQWACRIYNRVHRVLSGRADLILTTSEHYAALERRPRGPEVRVVPWGVDLRPRPRKAFAGERPLRVLFVGQMRGYKGVEHLVPAVAGQPELELRLVGDGPNRADYELLAQGVANIRFLGRISDEDLHAEYDRADVVVLPSVTQAEAFGLVTLEGMAAACVPVVSDLPGVRDLVDGVGLVVPPRDEAGLREALLGLARDVVNRRRLSGLARAKAERLSWDACVERYEDALLDTVFGGLSGGLSGADRARADVALPPAEIAEGA